MNHHARLLPIYLLAIATAFATVMYSQTGGAPTPGAAQGAGGAAGQPAQPPAQLKYDFNDHEGWKQIFDGRTLNGWDGSRNVWRVEDGAIIAETAVAHPTVWWVNGANTGSSMLILNGTLKNFEFKAEVKLEGAKADTGFFFRATRLGAIPDDVYQAQLQQRIPPGGPTVRPNNTPWEIRGYQADYQMNPNGNLGDCCNGPQRGVGQIDFGKNPLPPRRPGGASRGTATLNNPDGGKREMLGVIGDSKDLATKFNPAEWTQVEVIADGNTFMYIINGQLMSVWIDLDQKFGNAEGQLALELEGAGDEKAMFRNVWLKTLP